MSDDKKALANFYSVLVQTDGWKDLERYAQDEIKISMGKMDSKSASELTMNEVCEERGIRKGILKILNHVEYRKEGR